MDAADRPVQRDAQASQPPPARDEVRENLQRLRMALAAGGMGTWVWVPATQMVHCDARQLQLWDLDPAVPDVPAERIFERILPEDRGRLWTDDAKATAGQHLETEFRIRRSDGQVRWLAVYADVMRDEQDAAVRVVGVNYDITDRKQKESTLRQSTSLLQAISDTTGDAIFAKDREGRLTYANPATLALVGKPQEAVLGHTDMEFLEDKAAAAAVMANDRRIMESGVAEDLEEIVPLPDGTRRTWFSRKVPYRDVDGRVIGLLGVSRDITERKATVEALRIAKVAAEQASRAKDQFLAVLSHELRNPLAPVLATAGMLQREPGLSDEVREHLEVIRRNAELEARLIDDLLDVTRIARGKVELVKERAELCMVISRAIEVCRPDFEGRGIHFGVDWGGRPYWVDADIGRLQQVFWNLLKNAAKFTPHGGCVGVRCRWVDSLAEVAVVDSGIGIAADALPRLFSPFEQAERTITRQFGGLGLGLAICKAMVELHGGTITAHSPGKDKGATFRVRLPTTAPAGPPGPAPEPDAGQSRLAPAHPLRILLVEDHGDTARIMQRMLKLEGHSVAMAGDVATAVDLARQQGFDLLLSDMGLPDASGVDLLRQLRAMGYRFPAVALSGYGQEQDLQRSREAGFAAHLIKPVGIDQLLRTINSVAGRAERAEGEGI